jgi:hypothetical protein
LVVLLLLVFGSLRGTVASAEPITESEPNNTPATADALPAGTEYVTGAINPAGDQDYFAFEGQAGDLVFVSLDTHNAGPSQDSTLVLLDTDGTTVIEWDEDDGPTPLSSGIAGARLPRTGTFFLRVQESGDDQPLSAYTLYLGTVAPHWRWEVEPNDDLVSASQAGPLNGGYLWSSDAGDFWWFVARAGDVLSAGLDNDPDHNGTGGADFLLELFDPRGTSIAVANTDSGEGDPAEFLNVIGLPATGEYVLRVGDSRGVGAGPQGRYDMAIFLNGRPVVEPLAVEKTLVEPADGMATLGEPVVFEIRITNHGVNPITRLPLADNYLPDYLTYQRADPASNDNVNDGYITWTDLTAGAPHGFGTALAPGETFTVTTRFTAFSPTQVSTGTANAAFVEGAQAGSRRLAMTQAMAGVVITGTQTAAVTTFNAGWNLIALPLNPATSYTAESLGRAINAQGGTATIVQRWDGSGWQTHQVGLPFGDFAIALNEGYFVRANGLSNWTLVGYSLQPQAIALHAGWNLIAVPSGDYTAESLGRDINGQGGSATIVQHWDGSGWQTHQVGLPFGDFPIVVGQGYFVRCNSASTWMPTSP